ncbi:MAG: DUF1360 domain-containing protein [Solirubrobacteraceae bacterium]
MSAGDGRIAACGEHGDGRIAASDEHGDGRIAAGGEHGARPLQAAKEVYAHYAPGSERPLAAHAVLAGTYALASGGAALALLRAKRSLPERPNLGDLLLIGVASHKLSRLIAKDRVTSFVRAPFTRFQEGSGQGEVEEEAYGEGLRLAVGELLICPYCLAQWVATGLTLSLLASPRFTRMLSGVFVAHTISDFLQIVYHAAERHA